jgi:hypothetical protein
MSWIKNFGTHSGFDSLLQHDISHHYAVHTMLKVVMFNTALKGAFYASMSLIVILQLLIIYDIVVCSCSHGSIFFGHWQFVWSEMYSILDSDSRVVRHQ